MILHIYVSRNKCILHCHVPRSLIPLSLSLNVFFPLKILAVELHTLLDSFQECPVGTYKNVSGSNKALCHRCPGRELPNRAAYISVRGN